MVLFYRKIHYLTMEFRVKLHAKKDIDNRCQNRHRVSKKEARSVAHVWTLDNFICTSWLFLHLFSNFLNKLRCSLKDKLWYSTKFTSRLTIKSGSDTGRIIRTRTRLHRKLIKLKIHCVTPGTICSKMQCLIVFHMPSQHRLKCADNIYLWALIAFFSVFLQYATNKPSTGKWKPRLLLSKKF